MSVNFIKDLPVADIRIGAKQYMRIYGETAADVGLALVEIRVFRRGIEEVIRLHPRQAEEIIEGLIKAIAKAKE